MSKKKTPTGICTDCATSAIVWECGFNENGERRALCAWCLRQHQLRVEARRRLTPERMFN